MILLMFINLLFVVSLIVCVCVGGGESRRIVWWCGS